MSYRRCTYRLDDKHMCSMAPTSRSGTGPSLECPSCQHSHQNGLHAPTATDPRSPDYKQHAIHGTCTHACTCAAGLCSAVLLAEPRGCGDLSHLFHIGLATSGDSRPNAETTSSAGGSEAGSLARCRRRVEGEPIDFTEAVSEPIDLTFGKARH